MDNKQAILSYFSLLKEIDKNIIRPIYLIYGEEGYLHYSIVNKFKTYFSQQKQLVNYETFYGENLDINNLTSSIQTLSLGTGRQCIVIKQFEKIKKPLVEKINALIDKLPLKYDDLLILIFVEAKQIPKILNIENITKRGVIVSTPKLNISQMKQWVGSRFREDGKKIDEETIYHLLRTTENNFAQINNEIDKLLCYSGNSIDRISKKDLLKNVYGLQEGNIFEFVDTVGERKTEKALHLLKLLLDSNQYHPLQVLAMLSRQFRLIFKMKLSTGNYEKNKGDRSLPYFLVKKITTQSQKYKINEIKSAFLYLLKAEINLKTGYLLPDIVLEQLVVQITK